MRFSITPGEIDTAEFSQVAAISENGLQRPTVLTQGHYLCRSGCADDISNLMKLKLAEEVADNDRNHVATGYSRVPILTVASVQDGYERQAAEHQDDDHPERTSQPQRCRVAANQSRPDERGR
ncbi:hypothetical protein GCM10022234_22670 [Aeromicrobium panaciterrae]